jgi:FdrA protein
MSDAALVEVHPDTYLDSVLLLSATRSLLDAPDVHWGAALMGTAANLDVLCQEGFDPRALADIRANDLVLAARAISTSAASVALQSATTALFGRRAFLPAGAAGHRARVLPEAVEELPDANVAIVSVPGPFAALEAQRAISAGLHVLLFSDNVGVGDEVELKERARDAGLLVMGPGAGTAMLGGIGLGFANVVRKGPVGVVAAAGTGAQEVMSLVDRWGAGCSHVVGVGGRDLSTAVGGTMTQVALRALEDDPETSTILLVSKPPAATVAAKVLSAAGSKPLVAALIGIDGSLTAPERVHLARSLEQGAALAVELAGGRLPTPATGLAEVAATAALGLAPQRTAIHGLFAGGTLCYEAMVLLTERLGAVYSNTPLREEWTLPAPPGAHVCLDLGEEEYTRGRPHPMIDAQARTELIRREAADPAVAVLLIDVVLGHGAHPDPAAVLAPVLAEFAADATGPRVVAYVLGTEGDPQGAVGQRRRLEDAGCVVAPTAARAALLAAAIAMRRPEVAEEST